MALGRNFHKNCGKDGGKVGENPAALRAAVFSLSSKNLNGGVQTPPPPSRARVKPYIKLLFASCRTRPPGGKLSQEVCLTEAANSLDLSDRAPCQSSEIALRAVPGRMPRFDISEKTRFGFPEIQHR